MNNLSQHALSAAFPAMSHDELLALTADIENHGQHEPCVIFEDKVLDGWHRYSACIKIGTAAQVVQLPLELDPVAYVRSRNMHRRHLTESQRALAEALCNEWAELGSNQHPASILGIDAKAPARCKDENTIPKTNKEMAKNAGVSTATMSQAKAAIKAGFADDVRDGKISVKKASGYDKPAKPVKEAAPAYNPADDELAEAHETVRTLAAENQVLLDKMMVSKINDEGNAVFETIKELREIIRLAEIEIRALKDSRDYYMSENNELKSQCKSQRDQIKKLSK